MLKTRGLMMAMALGLLVGAFAPSPAAAVRCPPYLSSGENDPPEICQFVGMYNATQGLYECTGYNNWVIYTC